MAIVYRDDLGYVMENIRPDSTVEFLDDKVFFNDKVININQVVRIGLIEREV